MVVFRAMNLFTKITGVSSWVRRFTLFYACWTLKGAALVFWKIYRIIFRLGRLVELISLFSICDPPYQNES